MASEQRCTDLGANCLCNEPLQATTYTKTFAGWDPNDSTTKECDAGEGGANLAIGRNANDVAASTDATALAALPTGHSVSRFLKASNNHTGIFMVGNGVNVSSSYVRLSARWYRYHSPDFTFAYESTCTNQKVIEHNANARVSYQIDDAPWTDVHYHAYGFLDGGWSPGGNNCCTDGPAGAGSTSHFLKSEKLGKWWRYEEVLTHRAGPDFRMQLYAVNVTDDPDTEYLIIDLYENGQTDNMTPPGLQSAMLVNNYRESGCAGWYGTLHYLMAGWTTDAGQRIGAASEIEGGTPDTTPPTLSSPNAGTPTSIGTTNASVSTNEGNGLLYLAAVTNGGSCTAAQLKAGSGGNIVAASAGNQAVSGTGAQVIATIIGLSPSTLYQIKFLQTDNAGNDSAQASVNLTTAAGSGRTAKRAQYARRRE